LVGSNVVNRKLTSPERIFKHYHTNIQAGRRDPIPVMTDTVISFTAPENTHVNLYTKRVFNDAQESLLVSVQPGEFYSRKFTKEHTVVFDYAKATTEEITVTIKYPHFDRTAVGIAIKSIGWGGTFSVDIPNATPPVSPDDNGDGNVVTINNTVGDLLLVGVNTPYFNKDSLINVPTVGNVSVKTKLISPTVSFNQYIYDRSSGTKHTIPLLTDSTISFTAPPDACIIVKSRPNKGSDEETIEAYVLHGQYYEQSFLDVHTLTLTFISNMDEEPCHGTIGFCSGETIQPMVVSIRYPHYDISLVQGEINQYIYTSAQVQLPVDHTRSIIQAYKDRIKRGGVFIYQNTVPAVLVYSDDGYGNFVDYSGEMSSEGSVDYVTGVVTIPTELTFGNYYIIYDQDGFDNFAVDSFTVAELINPKTSFTSPDESLSKITLR